MSLKKGTAHCLVHQRDGEIFGNLVLPGEQDPYSFSDIRIASDDLKKAAEAFWLTVDRIMSQRELVKGDILSGQSYISLVARGAALRNCFGEEEFIAQLENAARCSDTISIVTDMLWFPWEAIYFGDIGKGAFLGHLVTIVRRPFKAKSKSKGAVRQPGVGLAASQKTSPQVILIDALLERSLVSNAAEIKETLRTLLESRTDGSGTQILISDKDLRFLGDVQKSFVVQWICEHDGEGLRLCEGAHFTEEICQVAPLGSGLLVLAGCETGGGRSERRDFANYLCSHNSIAVLAPTSKIGLEAAAFFSLRVHDAFEAKRNSGTTVLELWRSLNGGTTADVEEGIEGMSADSCFSLIFGLYGRVDQQLC